MNIYMSNIGISPDLYQTVQTIEKDVLVVAKTRHLYQHRQSKDINSFKKIGFWTILSVLST